MRDYVRIADELRELGCFLVSLEGGEPFSRPDLVEIVRAFGKHHLPVLFTNGWLVTKDNANALWDAGLAARQRVDRLRHARAARRQTRSSRRNGTRVVRD